METTTEMETTAEIGEFDCFCKSCNGTLNTCLATRRVKAHCEEVNVLLTRSCQIVTILAGPNKTKLSCHKILLGFYSLFFKAACYGRFAEAANEVVEMPEDDPVVVGAYISWLYSGQIQSPASLEMCWILGDKIQSVEFANEAMYSMFDLYGRKNGASMTAQTAALIWAETMPDALLRKFAKKALRTIPPLSRQALHGQTGRQYQEDWENLIMKGGELVVHIMFINNYRDAYATAPYNPKNQDLCLLPVQARKVEEFVLFHESQTKSDGS